MFFCLQKPFFFHECPIPSWKTEGSGLFPLCPTHHSLVPVPSTARNTQHAVVCFEKRWSEKKKKICSLWHSLALELFDLTNHISQQRKHWRQCPFPGQRLIPRGVPAAAAARGADPFFPSCCSRHFSTPGDRRAPGKRGRVRDVTAESGMLGQRCSKCAVPWK